MKINSRSLFPIILMLIGVLLVVGSVYWSIQANKPQASYLAASSASKLPYPDVHRISLGEAKLAHEQGSAIFVDVRGEPYFSQGHIPGALSIAEDELLDRVVDIDPSTWVITYCT